MPGGVRTAVAGEGLPSGIDEYRFELRLSLVAQGEKRVEILRVNIDKQVSGRVETAQIGECPARGVVQFVVVIGGQMVGAYQPEAAFVCLQKRADFRYGTKLVGGGIAGGAAGGEHLAIGAHKGHAEHVFIQQGQRIQPGTQFVGLLRHLAAQRKLARCFLHQVHEKLHIVLLLADILRNAVPEARPEGVADDGDDDQVSEEKAEYKRQGYLPAGASFHADKHTAFPPSVRDFLPLSLSSITQKPMRMSKKLDKK